MFVFFKYVLSIFFSYFNGFLEVAIESWPYCDLKPQPLRSIQML